MKKSYFLVPIQMLILLLFVVIFWYPPMKYHDSIEDTIFKDSLHTKYSIDPGISELDNYKKSIILTGYKKAIDEISKRNDYGHDWFHYKFLIIGAIISVLVYSTRKSKHEEFKVLIESDRAIIIFGVCTLICFCIDIHIRQNITVTNQLGMWVAHYIEPLVSNDVITPEKSTSYLGWEQFLRVKIESKDNVILGLHQDYWYSAGFWPALHILTWIMYFLYATLRIHQPIKFRDEKNRAKVFLFYSIHITIIVYAIMGTILPSSFELNVFPFMDDGYISPKNASVIFAGIGIAILLFNLLLNSLSVRIQQKEGN